MVSLGKVFHGTVLASGACLCKARAAAGRDTLREDSLPACQVHAVRTGNAEEGTRSGSRTLTLLNFDTTYREVQRLRVCQGNVGSANSDVGLLTSAVVLLRNLATLRPVLHTPCLTPEL